MVTQFPVPQVDPLFLKDAAAFPSAWVGACAAHLANFQSALAEIGATLVSVSPSFPTKYFQIEHDGGSFSLGWAAIADGARIKKLANKNRMKVIHEIVDEFRSYDKDLFYSSVQGVIRGKTNFSSKLDGSLNQMLFSIVTDMLRAQGFKFHMD